MDPKKVPSVKLNNGMLMPIIGLGTWQVPADDTIYRAIRTAIDAGYRHLDCAFFYENQEEIGRAVNDAIRELNLKREDFFIVSKIWPTYHRRDRVMQCVKIMLAKFQTPYLDLCLHHFPVSFAQREGKLFPTDGNGKLIGEDIDYIETYKGLEDCLKAGLVKSIGISNFTQAQIERLLPAVSTVPVTNQVECHPYLPRTKLKKFCEDKGITLTAYSPLGNPNSNWNDRKDKGQLLKDPVVLRLAKKYGKNVGQILIKFQTDRGLVVIPKSSNPDRIKSNIQIFDFKLTADEIKELESLDRNYRSFLLEITRDLPNYPFGPSIEN